MTIAAMAGTWMAGLRLKLRLMLARLTLVGVALVGVAQGGGLAAAADPPITALRFDSAGEHLVCGSQRGVEVIRWCDRQRIHVWPAPWPNVHDLQFTADGRRLVIAGGVPGELGGVALLSWPEGELLLERNVHDDVVYRVAVSPDGQWLATASADRHVKLLSGDRLSIHDDWAGHSQPVTCVALLEQQDPGVPPSLLTAGVDHSLRLWISGHPQPQRSLENHTGPVTDLALRPAEGSMPIVATSGEDSTVRFWQPTIGRLVRFTRLDSPPTCIEWTPDGQQLIAACRDGVVRSVDPQGLSIVSERRLLPGWIYSLAVHPRVPLVVAGGAGGRIEAGQP